MKALNDFENYDDVVKNIEEFVGLIEDVPNEATDSKCVSGETIT